MEVGNILRNFCLESTTISKAARQEGVKREREGTGSREGIRVRGRAVSQWGGVAVPALCRFLLRLFVHISFLITRCHLAMPQQRGRRRKRGLS